MARTRTANSNQDSYSSNKADQSDEMTEGSSAPAELHGLDLSKYRQPDLVAALDRLTSFTYAGSLLLKPAMKIMWRSAFYQDADVRLNELLSKLKGSSPVTQPPAPIEEEVPPQSSSSQQPPSQARRSLSERVIHFLTVGLPMAIFVGLAYGIVNFVTCIYGDISQVASTSQQLFFQAKEDINYYMAHPESRPTKDEAINAWTAQIIGPYTKTIVQRKLGPLAFLSSPITSVVQRLVKRFASSSATELQHYAKKYKNFDVFQSQSQAQVS